MNNFLVLSSVPKIQENTGLVFNRGADLRYRDFNLRLHY